MTGMKPKPVNMLIMNVPNKRIFIIFIVCSIIWLLGYPALYTRAEDTDYYDNTKKRLILYLTSYLFYGHYKSLDIASF